MNRHIPPALSKTIWLTLLIGLGCICLGTLYFLKTKDRILLFLSLSVFLGCAAKALFLYRTARKRRYETVEGTCVNAVPKAFGNMQTVRLLGTDGAEHTLCLPKTCKLRAGGHYRLYFTQRDLPWSASSRLDAALKTDGFLGYERTGDGTSSASS